MKTEGKAKRQKPEALEESLKLQLAQLVEASKAYYRTRLSDKFPWADLFKVCLKFSMEWLSFVLIEPRTQESATC